MLQRLQKIVSPCRSIRDKRKLRRKECKIEAYTDGNKSANGVCSGIAIFFEKRLTYKLKYKLANRYYNNQAEQIVIARALKKMKDLYHLKGNQRT
jgi:ribonuclease HI